MIPIYAYDAAGFNYDALSRTLGNSAPWNACKFTGKEQDPESGLDNFEKRYHNSSLGRLTSPDPVYFQAAMLTDPERLNEYAYTRNNPLRYIDPSGEAKPILLVVLITAGLEIWHYARLHDLLGYGWHADLLKRSAEIGIPGVRTSYALWLTNNTACPQIFQGIKLPGGYVGSGIVYRDRIERWDARQRTWVKVRELTRSEMPNYSLVTRRYSTRLETIRTCSTSVFSSREGTARVAKFLDRAAIRPLSRVTAVSVSGQPGLANRGRRAVLNGSSS